MQLGFYFDQTRCTGCLTCVIACRDWHDIPAGPVNLISVKTIEKGKYPELFAAFVPAACFHCQSPACARACPANAITKHAKDGVVTVDSEACLGKDCQLCFEACPYHAPQFGAEQGAGMQKCDLCHKRWEEGRKPVCIEGCPMFALDAGPLNDLKEKYGGSNEAEGFEFLNELLPSILFKPKKPK